MWDGAFETIGHWAASLVPYGRPHSKLVVCATLLCSIRRNPVMSPQSRLDRRQWHAFFMPEVPTPFMMPSKGGE
jgi:hypothetical protein